MKKVTALVFFMFCGLIVFLATVDLAPYLSRDNLQLHETPTPPTQEQSGQIDIGVADISAAQGETAIPDRVEETEPPEITPINESSTVEAAKAIKTDQEPPIEIKQSLRIEQEKGGVATIEPQLTATSPSKTNAFPASRNNPSDTQMEVSGDLEITELPEGNYPFSILLETFNLHASAQHAKELYREYGISTYWVKLALSEKKIKYRLFTGIFSTSSEAQDYLKKEGLRDKWIKETKYSVRIGVYQDKEKLVIDFNKTGSVGVIPYILGTENGAYHLYVGAFYTLVGASEQCNKLIGAGLSCKPIKRTTLPE